MSRDVPALPAGPAGTPPGEAWGRRLSDRIRAALDAGDLGGARRLARDGDGLARSLERETLARRLREDAAFERARADLLEQIGQELARIHAVPAGGLGCLGGAGGGATPAEAQLADLERELREIEEPHPALELGLRRHLSGAEPSLELASIGRHCAEVEWELLRLLGKR